MNLSSEDFFFAGGTLSPNAPSYVKRPADDELFNYILAGEYCHILTPRQMGKSSLMYRTVQRLHEKGIKSAVVQMQNIDEGISEDLWYKAVLRQIQRSLKLEINLDSWWSEKHDTPNVQKFIDFFEEMLTKLDGQFVVFMDEIDATLKFRFRDDFFVGIRSIFIARSETPNLKRLSFVLLGVASPSDLIRDRVRTPFNIGRKILLKPFSRADAFVLDAGLEKIYPGFGQMILDKIFYWTNGHPYLTQRLCQIAVKENFKKYNDREIDKLVERNFLSEESSDETNLEFVRVNVLEHRLKRSMLKTYENLLEGKKILDNKNSLEQSQLRLAGLVTVENKNLVISNEIYRRVFDQEWVKKNTEINWRLLISYALTLIAITSLLYLSAIVYRDVQYISNQPNRIPECFNRSPYPEKRFQCLAEAFHPDTRIIPYDNSGIARELFFSQPSWIKQKELFTLKDPNSESLKGVIEGLYTYLADVDNSNQNIKLLKQMSEALTKAGLKDDKLAKEIQAWIEARELSNLEDEDYAGALGKYDEAIKWNDKNPSTLFERARINTLLGNFESALIDYEQVIEISPKPESETVEQPTSTSTSTPTSTPTRTPTLTPTSTFTPTFTSTPYIGYTLTPVFGITEIPTVISVTQSPEIPMTTLIVEPTLSPTPEPDNTPVQSKFLSLIDRIDAVKNDINQNEALNSFLTSVNPTNYPSLTEWGIFPATPTFVTLTPTDYVARVNIDSPCRSGTNSEFDVITTIPQGRSVMVIGNDGSSNGLFLIRWGSFPDCWVESRFLTTNFDVNLLTPISTPFFTFTRTAVLLTITESSTVTLAPNSTSLPSTYSPILVFDRSSFNNQCWENETNLFSDQLEGFSQRDDGNWRFGVGKGRTLDESIETDFSQCFVNQQVSAIALNAFVLRGEPLSEFGIFVEDGNGQRREYTFWVDSNDNTVYLSIRETDGSRTEYLQLSIVPNLDGSFPSLYYQYSIKIFLELNNQGLDILYLSQGSGLQPLNLNDINPSQMRRLDYAIRPTLGNIQKTGLIGYGGETQIILWPLVFYSEGQVAQTVIPPTNTLVLPPTNTLVPLPTSTPRPFPTNTPGPRACNDGIDNDNDGKTDFPADDGCRNNGDDSE